MHQLWSMQKVDQTTKDILAATPKKLLSKCSREQHGQSKVLRSLTALMRTSFAAIAFDHIAYLRFSQFPEDFS